MRGYGLGPNLSLLLTRYWYRQRIAPKSGKYLGKYFRTRRGVTQGDPISPMIFNIVVDAVVREVLGVVCGTQEAQHGLGWEAGDRNLVFYTNNDRLAGRDHEWMQEVLTVTVEMLHRMVLETNLYKTKSMVCITNLICGKWGEQAYKRRAVGEGETFRERKRM